MSTTGPQLEKLSGNIQRLVNRALFFKFLFDPNDQILEIQHFSKWALLQHPNILPLFGLVNDPAIPSIGIVTPRCTFNDLRCFFSNPTRASKANRLEIVSFLDAMNDLPIQVRFL
jgi:hypothetical protein